MRRKVHLCQSVPGALANWKRKDWEHVAKANNTTVNAIREAFKIMEFEGKLVIPIGEPCEGFDYKTGCPGHLVEDDK